MGIVQETTVGRRQFCLRFLGLIGLTSLPGCGSSPTVEEAENDARQEAERAARIRAFGGNGSPYQTSGPHKTKGRIARR